jgi:hypothetical protein
MGLLLVTWKRSWVWLKHWLWTLADALPPYRHTEGLLDTKETYPDGKFYISVGPERVEVDAATFEALMVGETLRIRYTRGGRAVNIDRLLPGRGQG